MADDESEAGAPAPSATPDAGGQLRSDEREEVPPSDVIVRGRGTFEEVLKVLRRIAETRRRPRPASAAGGADRAFRNKDEFVSVAQRVAEDKATVVLTKWFLWRGACNVMQEIWIEDQENPDADPLKEYAVAHVHHHARVGRPEDITPEDLKSVDAINMRHIVDSASPNKGNRDNPFGEWIEPYGNTLFPPDKWSCEKCGCKNFPNKMQCRTASCDGKQKCTKWEWRSNPGVDPHFHCILKKADELDKVWISGPAYPRLYEKNRAAGGGTQTQHGTLQELMGWYKAFSGPEDPRKCQECLRSPCSTTCSAWNDLKVAMLCLGISKYARMDHLPNAASDARVLHDQLNALNELGVPCKAEVRTDEELKTRSNINECIRTFLSRLTRTPPDTVLIACSGHGEQREGVYLVPGDENPTDPTCDHRTVLFPVQDILRFCRDDLDHPARIKQRKQVSFLVIIDACRVSDSASVRTGLDAGTECPEEWAMFFSCSRGTTAKDGPVGEQSPFVKELLHPKEGIFVEGVGLRKGLEDACSRLKAQQMDQVAFPVGWYSIQDKFCLFPARSKLKTALGNAHLGAGESLELSFKSTSDWAALPAPVPPEPPYCILFVGANSSHESQLNLETELSVMCHAFIQRHGSKSWEDNVIFKHSFFSSTADLSRALRLYNPTCLHISCQGCTSALAQFGKDLAAQDLVEFIASWCTSGKRLQLIIANACDSAKIVQSLSQHVDFVIGHSTPVADADAVNFARELYAHLGAGESLKLSFNAAKMVSSPYCLLGRKNAGMFRLLPPSIRGAGLKGKNWQHADDSQAMSMASTDAQRSQTSWSSAGQPSSTSNREPVPQVSGYVVDKKLGAGGQGTVWLATCQDGQDTKVAIKMCQKKYAQLQEREMENLFALSDLQHPNIVRYMEFRKKECALIMEYVNGISLNHHLEGQSGEKRALEWDESSMIMFGILSGLKCLHGMNGTPMLHRDVKPDNVMLSATPVQNETNVILVDFGLSKRMGVNQTQTLGEKFIGTPSYLCPEVCKGMPSRDLDPRVDVWAAGVVLYEMLAGELPFSGENDLRLIEAIKGDQVKRIGVAGSGVNAFISRALEKKQEKRFTDAADMLEVFEEVCKNRHSVPEQLIQPQRPSTLDLQVARSAQPQGGTGPALASHGEPAEVKKPQIVAFFAKKRTDVADLLEQVRHLKDACTDKEDLAKECIDLLNINLERLNLHEEAQRLMLGFQDPRSLFEISVHAQPTYDDFSGCMLMVREKNTRIVHVSGHSTRRSGFLWLKDTSTDYEERPIEDFAKLFEEEGADEDGGTIECVVLNACETEGVGRQLLAYGVPNVVCWRSEVRDVTAMTFSKHFYKALDIQHEGKRDYKRAFKQAAKRLTSLGDTASKRKPAKHQAQGAVDFVCLLTKDEDVFPETGFIRADNSKGSSCSPDDQDMTSGFESNDDESTRNWRVPGILADGTEIDADTDYAALAGKAERECMELLGFPMTLRGESEPIKVGKGIKKNGFITDQRVFRMWGVNSYTSGVWGYDERGGENKAIQNAKNVSFEKIEQAVAELRDVEKYRDLDMRKPRRRGGGNARAHASHAHQLKQIIDTREALERMIQDRLGAGMATMSVTRGVSLGEGCQRTGANMCLETSDASGHVGTATAGTAASQAQVEPAGRGAGLKGKNWQHTDDRDRRTRVSEASGALAHTDHPAMSGVGLGGKDKHADDSDRHTRVSEASDPDAESCGSTSAEPAAATAAMHAHQQAETEPDSNPNTVLKQGELSIEEKGSLQSFFRTTWKTGTCKLTRSSLSFIDRTTHTIYDLKDFAVLKIEQESGMYVIVVKTANRVLRFSHQNPSEAFRWLQAFVDAGQGLSD